MQTTPLKPETELAIFHLCQKWFGDRYRPLVVPLDAPELLSVDLIFAEDYHPNVREKLEDEFSIDVTSTDMGLIAHTIGFWRRQLLNMFCHQHNDAWYDEEWKPVETPYPEGVQLVGFCRDLLEILANEPLC